MQPNMSDSGSIPKYVLADGDSYLHGVNDAQGYWDKTSSVNFCERDFEKSSYVAEFHNTWSSLVIIILPFLGLLYSNPTAEWRFTLAYIVLMITGTGSMILHTTLSTVGQRLDEIPMLWMCVCILYCLLDNKSKKEEKNSPLVPLGCVAFVILETTIYFQIQSLYEVFVTGYLSMVLTIMSWTAKICWYDESKVQSLLRGLWSFSVLNYVVVGSSVWFLDMYYCEEWRVYYDAYFGGMTWHIIWHFGAAWATYCTVQQLIVMRLDKLGQTPRLAWKFGCLPIVEVVESKRGDKSKNTSTSATPVRRSRRLTSKAT